MFKNVDDMIFSNFQNFFEIIESFSKNYSLIVFKQIFQSKKFFGIKKQKKPSQNCQLIFDSLQALIETSPINDDPKCIFQNISELENRMTAMSQNEDLDVPFSSIYLIKESRTLMEKCFRFKNKSPFNEKLKPLKYIHYSKSLGDQFLFLYDQDENKHLIRLFENQIKQKKDVTLDSFVLSVFLLLNNNDYKGFKTKVQNYLTENEQVNLKKTSKIDDLLVLILYLEILFKLRDSNKMPQNIFKSLVSKRKRLNFFYDQILSKFPNEQIKQVVDFVKNISSKKKYKTIMHLLNSKESLFLTFVLCHLNEAANFFENDLRQRINQDKGDVRLTDVQYSFLWVLYPLPYFWKIEGVDSKVAFPLFEKFYKHFKRKHEENEQNHLLSGLFELILPDTATPIEILLSHFAIDRLSIAFDSFELLQETGNDYFYFSEGKIVKLQKKDFYRIKKYLEDFTKDIWYFMKDAFRNKKRVYKYLLGQNCEYTKAKKILVEKYFQNHLNDSIDKKALIEMIQELFCQSFQSIYI